VNRVIAAAAHRYPNVMMANWFAAIGHRTGLLWPDEVTPSARRGWALRSDGRHGGPGRPDGGHRGLGTGSGLPPAAHHIAPLS
jgi:hypothetical protein